MAIWALQTDAFQPDCTAPTTLSIRTYISFFDIELSVFYQNVQRLKSKLTTIYKNSILSDVMSYGEQNSLLKLEDGGCLIAAEKSITSYIQESWFSNAEDI